MKIVSRKEAINENFPRYFTGKPCKRGHLAERYTSTGMCINCQNHHHEAEKESGRAKYYRKTYYESNKEEVLTRQKTRKRICRENKPYILLMQGARKRSKNLGISFDLDIEWAESRWTGKCELTQIEFDLGHSEKTGQPFSPSIDKIDRNKGYTKENCRFILLCINQLKGIMDDEQMYSVAKSLIDNCRLAGGIPRL